MAALASRAPAADRAGLEIKRGLLQAELVRLALHVARDPLLMRRLGLKVPRTAPLTMVISTVVRY